MFKTKKHRKNQKEFDKWVKKRDNRQKSVFEEVTESVLARAAAISRQKAAAKTARTDERKRTSPLATKRVEGGKKSKKKSGSSSSSSSKSKSSSKSNSSSILSDSDAQDFIEAMEDSVNKERLKNDSRHFNPTRKSKSPTYMKKCGDEERKRIAATNCYIEQKMKEAEKKAKERTRKIKFKQGILKRLFTGLPWGGKKHRFTSKRKN